MGSIFCNYCDKAYHPEGSTAENKELFCSQACEVADELEESEETDDE